MLLPPLYMVRLRLHRALAVALLLWVGACDSKTSPAVPGGPSPAQPPPLVVAFGDSLTAGPGLRPSETYPARLQERISAVGLPHVVVNEGVSGDTTGDGLRRLDAVLARGPQVLIVALGANDGLRGIPVDVVRGNLDTIIQRARGQGIRVLLCGMETPPTHGWSYTLDFHVIFPELAQRHGVALMPFLLTGVVGRRELNLEDGYHPNAAGARRIAENMWPYLEPLLR